MAKPREGHPQRVPMHEQGRNLLTVRDGYIDEANFKYRWFNDVGDRIARAVKGGYEHVSDPGVEVGDKHVDGTRSVGAVVSKSVGMGTVAYLMKIPKELWEQDQAAKQTVVDETEVGLKRLANRPGWFGGYVKTNKLGEPIE